MRAEPNWVPGAVPDLRSLASEWLEADGLSAVPAISNFWGAVSAGHNVLGVRHLTLPPYTQSATEACVLKVDGAPVPAEMARWSAFEITRIGQSPSGLRVTTRARLAFESCQLLLEVRLSNASGQTLDTELSIGLDAHVGKATKAWTWKVPRPADCDFVASAGGAGNVLIAHGSSAAVTGFALHPAPGALRVSGPAVAACWPMTLQPGASALVQLVLSVGDTPTGCPLTSPGDGQAVVDRCNEVMGEFGHVFANAGDGWQRRWQQAFTPGNPHYSGSLPVLSTDDEGLARLYYMSALSVIMCERTNFGPQFSRLLERPTEGFDGLDRVYVTGAPQFAASLTYFWDTSYCSVLLALLDPAVLRILTQQWLAVDIRCCYATDCITGGPAGPWYSANDVSVFTTFCNYVKYSGDWAYLSAVVSGKTVLQHLTDCATHWRSLVAPGQSLADYGDPENLLEVLPEYTNQVASFNAANVWMMREAAGLHRAAGDEATACSLLSAAATLERDVLALYVAGEGIWGCRHADGTVTPVRTVLDFAIASNLLAGSLSGPQKAEMMNFVTTELLEGDWMRALSNRDSQAPVTRPDHGTTGSYDAWPAFAAQTFARFGEYRSALTMLKTFAGVTYLGPFGQSHQVELQASRQHVEDRAELNPAQALTLMAWVNADGWPEDISTGTIIAKDTWACRDAGYVLRGGAGGALSFAIAVNGRWCELRTEPLVHINGRHHVAAVYDGATMTLYVDGVQRAQRDQTGPITPSTGVPVMFGSSPADRSRTFEGSIDGAGIWARALSAEEIGAAHSAGNTVEANPGAGCVFMLPLAPSAPLPASVVSGGIQLPHAVCGGKFAEVLITDVFGFCPDGPGALVRDAGTSRGAQGTLSGIRLGSSRYTVASGRDGLTVGLVS